MTETLAISTNYQVKFTNKEPVSVSEIIASLQGYEKLLKRVGPFIEESFKGIEVVNIDVYVATLESGSWIQKFLVKVFFQEQEDYDQASQVASKIINNNRVIQGVVCIGVGALLYHGVATVLGPSKPSVNIQAYNGAVVQTGGTMNITKDSIDTILKGISDPKTLGKEAINALTPAYSDKDAIIEIEGQSTLTITQGFLQEAPTEYEPPQPIEISQKYTDVEIEIWASDRESNTKSWAGVVPGVVSKRVRFVLDDSVNPAALHGKLRVTADIEVTSKLVKAKKEYVPKVVLIEQIGKEKP